MYKKIIIVILLVISIVLSTLSLINKSKPNELERVALINESNTVSNYLSIIKDTKDIDKYIVYLLNTNYENELDDTLTIIEVKTLMEEKFGITLTEEDIVKVGVTDYMIERNITFGIERSEYSLNKSNISVKEIADTKIEANYVKKIVKKKNKYIVTYNSYKIDNPYKIINYYNDKYKDADLISINNYVNNKGGLKEVRDIISEELCKEVGEKNDSIIVTYIVKNGYILIENVK